MLLTSSLIGAPAVPQVPTVEAAAHAKQVAPNSQIWRQQAEVTARENQLLRAEIDRLKAEKRARQEAAVTRKDDSPTDASTYVVTAYTSGEESTGKAPGHPNYGVTASGAQVQAGVTAACPPELPFGTRLEIDGVGVRTCADRGGAIKGKRLDVYMPELADARKFGRQTLSVKILD